MARGELKARDFVFLCEELTLRRLPAGFPASERKMMWTTLQFAYGGDPDIHFELQPQMGRRSVELGLHFESSPERNAAWGALVAAEADAILASLGPEWELEEWTASWWRLHRTMRFEGLSHDLAAEVAEEFARSLEALVPFVLRSAAALRDGEAGGALARVDARPARVP